MEILHQAIRTSLVCVRSVIFTIDITIRRCGMSSAATETETTWPNYGRTIKSDDRIETAAK